MLPIEQVFATAHSSRPIRRSQSYVLPSWGALAPNSRGAHAPSRVVVGALANHNKPSSTIAVTFGQPPPRPKHIFLPNEPIFVHARLSFFKKHPVKRTHFQRICHPYSPQIAPIPPIPIQLSTFAVSNRPAVPPCPASSRLVPDKFDIFFRPHPPMAKFAHLQSNQVAPSQAKSSQVKAPQTTTSITSAINHPA